MTHRQADTIKNFIIRMKAKLHFLYTDPTSMARWKKQTLRLKIPVKDQSGLKLAHLCFQVLDLIEQIQDHINSFKVHFQFGVYADDPLKPSNAFG